ncbi:ABC transporter ATP-binding protein [Alginatibacterium sediminis]|uniref:ABC transporter ATP-binding protein n=1 Tax=Alginatibacterium sediminis TaxID=2164068 RepID=A0A420E716_9ALTE|nr:ABC transporter ATP-binding protein [Alginatibacterium sediminis]RKF13718.1 ABC transporter ATP-binding protein [Alginatibacterium sediminis]
MNTSPHHHQILVELIRSKKWLYIGSALALAFASLFMFLVPTIGQVAIDFVVNSDTQRELPSWLDRFNTESQALSAESVLVAAGLLVVVATVLGGLFMYLKDYLAAKACESTIMSLRERLFAHIHRIEESYLAQSDSGDIVQRCTSDIDTLRDFLTIQVMNIGRTVVLVIVMLPLMFWKNVPMTVVSTILLPIVFLFAWKFFERIKILFQKVDEAESELTTIVQENLTGIRVVRAFARQDFECEKFDKGNQQYSELHLKLLKMLANFWSLSDLICFMQSGLVLIGGAWLVIHNQLSVGAYFAFIGYAGMLIWPIRQLGQELSEAGKATVAIGRIQEILNAPEEQELHALQAMPTLKGAIKFSNVSFKFDQHQPTLSNLNFSINAGETIAIVGPTGAGKSTLFQILMRLQDYQSGSVTLDGYELNTLARQQVREQMGSLLQEPFLFSRSLRENIKFGELEASDEQMFQSSTAAAVHHTIEQFKHGYETRIGERGVSLSGGQKQRVTLSRTLIKQTPILLLDDTLSAVDSATEQQIIGALHQKRGEQTLMIITHRISVCLKADRILVMQDGQLAASGTHQELINTPGFYQDLWAIQSGQRDNFSQEVALSV